MKIGVDQPEKVKEAVGNVAPNAFGGPYKESHSGECDFLTEITKKRRTSSRSKR